MMVSFSGTITVMRRTNALTQTLFTEKYQELPKPPEANNPDIKSYTGVLHYRTEDFVTFIYENQTIASEKVYVGGIPWSFIVKAKKINGNNGAAASNVLGFYARCGYDFDKDNDNLNKITANLEMSMKPSNDSSKEYTRKFNETYSKGHSEWGFAEFRTIEEGVVQSHKSCVFEAKITVVRPKPETSQENLLKKVKEYMKVATMQAKRGNIDLAIEANEQASRFCYEKKDDVFKELDAQRNELNGMKMNDTIERLQKKEEDVKSTIPLRSACKHVGVMKKPPKNKKCNQRTRIKLTAPMKTKIMRSVGVNTEENDVSSSTPGESSPVLPKPFEVVTPGTHTEDEIDVSKELNGLVAIFKLLFGEHSKQRNNKADLVKIEHGLVKLLEMKSSALKAIKFNADSSNLHKTLEKLIAEEISNNNNGSFRTPNGLAGLLAAMVFSSTDTQNYKVEMEKYFIQAAMNHRKILKSVSLICQTFYAIVPILRIILKKFKVPNFDESVIPEAANEFFDCVDETSLPTHFKQILKRLANNALYLKGFFHALELVKDGYVKDFLAHQALVQNFKDMESTYNQKLETQAAVKRLLIEQLELLHKMNKELRDKHDGLLMHEKNYRESEKRQTFKGASYQKLFKDNEKMKDQVRRCEELLGRLKNERDDLLKSKADAANQIEKQRETLVKEIDECKKSISEFEMKLSEANNALSSKQSFSAEKEALRTVYLKTLEHWYDIAAEKMRIINFYLEKDKRYLTALLPFEVEICIVDRRSKNSTIQKSIQSCLNSIKEEMDMVKKGTLPMNFSKIMIPPIFIDEFGEI